MPLRSPRGSARGRHSYVGDCAPVSAFSVSTSTRGRTRLPRPTATLPRKAPQSGFLSCAHEKNSSQHVLHASCWTQTAIRVDRPVVWSIGRATSTGRSAFWTISEATLPSGAPFARPQPTRADDDQIDIAASSKIEDHLQPEILRATRSRTRRAAPRHMGSTSRAQLAWRRDSCSARAGSSGRPAQAAAQSRPRRR